MTVKFAQDTYWDAGYAVRAVGNMAASVGGDHTTLARVCLSAWQTAYALVDQAAHDRQIAVVLSVSDRRRFIQLRRDSEERMAQIRSA